MLKRLINGGEPRKPTPPSRDLMTQQQLQQEMTELLKDKPTFFFAPTSAPAVMLENLQGFCQQSTRVMVTFVACVIVPTLLTIAYLTFYASDQYETEMSFTVQQGSKSQRSVTGVMALAAQISGFSSTSQETFMVLEYLRSTAVVHDIGEAAFLEPIFARNDIDYLARMDAQLPVEDIVDYWRDKVIPELDARSGIVNLKIRTFSAEDSELVAKKLLQLMEKLVNEISLRSRNETLHRVEQDVKRSADILGETRRELLSFRNTEQSIDPVQDAEQIGTMITDLTLKRIELETELETMTKQSSLNSPATRVKKDQVGALNQQIAKLEARLTGASGESDTVSSKLIEYETLKTELAYREKLYSITLSGYEQAREEVEKQQIFVIPIVSPSVAESSTYPNFLETTASVFMLCAALWSVLALTIAAVRDHSL